MPHRHFSRLSTRSGLSGAPRGVSRAGHRPNSSISPFGKNLYLSLSLICISPTQYAWFFYCLAHLCYNGYICQNFLK